MEHRLLIKNIREKNFEKIYFLHGEEAYFIDEIEAALCDHVLEEHERDFNQTIVYGKDAELLSLISELKGFPMMAERRLIILREAQDFKQLDELDSYFQQPSESTVFVVCHKYKTFDARKKSLKSAAKNGVIYRSDKVRDYQLPDWIQTYVKSTGYTISGKASMLLAEFLGNDLSRIVNELKKLQIILEKGTAINEVHIEENIGISKDYNVFELTNALGAHDIPKAFKIVNYFDQNPKSTDIVVVISMVFRFYTQLMRIHFLPNKSKEAVAGALRVPPFAATELINAAKVYNPKKIAANIAILHEYDLKSKGVGNSSYSQGELMREMIFRLMN
jgi:DNA polymerase-3 subunit delta